MNRIESIKWMKNTEGKNEKELMHTWLWLAKYSG